MTSTERIIASLPTHRLLLVTGALGALGALLVGIGEFAMQFSPAGGYEAADYGYFTHVPSWRLTWGHFLGVLSAPLYLAGYLHVFLAMRPPPPRGCASRCCCWAFMAS